MVDRKKRASPECPTPCYPGWVVLRYVCSVQPAPGESKSRKSQQDQSERVGFGKRVPVNGHL